MDHVTLEPVLQEPVFILIQLANLELFTLISDSQRQNAN